MSKSTKTDITSNIEECLAMADLQSNDLGELTTMLKLRTNYYREQTSKMECLFSKMQLMDERLQMFEECTDLLEKLNNLQNKFNLKELTPNSVALSYAHHLRKHNNYSAKLKVCLKLYIELNETLSKNIKLLKSVYEEGQHKIDKIVTATMDEVKTLGKKINRYEHELTKLENKHVWLKDSDYNLPNISKEVNLLITARREKDQLLKELCCYCGLKPDLEEASEQLSQIKLEYEEMNKKLMDKQRN